MQQKNNEPETLRDFKCGKCANQTYETVKSEPLGQVYRDSLMCRIKNFPISHVRIVDSLSFLRDVAVKLVT